MSEDSTTIERLDIEVDDEALKDGVEMQVFRLDEPLRIVLGETAGSEVSLESQYFAAVSVDREASELEQQMGSPDTIDNATVIVSNEDAEPGEMVLDELDEADIDDAIEAFAEEYLEEDE